VTGARRPVLLTGPPGTGKSTLLAALSERFADLQQTGFVTHERRVEGRRDGFELALIGTGQRGLLASPAVASDVRFGGLRDDGKRRLGVDLTFLEEVACPTVLRELGGAELVLLDEVGPMQAVSAMFRALVERLLYGQAVLVATVAQSKDPWIAPLHRAAVDQGHELQRRFSNHRSVRDSLVGAVEHRLGR
jgi:nucleoside-triphosphatase THEP1